MEQFTKQEAFDLLGKIVRFRKTMYLKGLGIKVPIVQKGAVGDVRMVSSEPESLEVIVLVDDDLYEFDRRGFYTYCKVLKSGNVSHACAV